MGRRPPAGRIVCEGRVLAGRARVAASLFSRMVGLLTRASLDEDEALVIPAGQAIHTIGMRFPIDVAFVNQAWCVVAMRHALPPGRLTPVIWQAAAAIEFAAGTLRRCGVRLGDHLSFQTSGTNAS